MEQVEDSDNLITDEKRKELQDEIENLRKHACLKNFDGFSKSMESDAIVTLVQQAPSVLGSYIRVIVMDDDTTTRDNLKVDEGPKSAGRLEECLSGIIFLSDLF